HELVRRALYDRLTGIRRAELHLRVGEALASTELAGGRGLADLAHHFTAAAPLGGAQRGVEYNLLAARAASAALAFDEAVARLRSGLACALDFRGDHERAAVVRAGAVEMARELGDGAGLATVLTRAFWSRGAHAGEEMLAILDEAAAIGDELGDTEIVAEAMCWRLPTFVAPRDVGAGRRDVAALGEAAERASQPVVHRDPPPDA